MIKKLKASNLQVGMFVSEVHSSWISAPIVMSKFKIKSRKDINHILKYDIEYVSIDTEKGIDLGDVKEMAIDERFITPGETFEVALSEFWLNRPMPVDLYTIDNVETEHILKKGLAFSFEVFELFSDRKIWTARVPLIQRDDFDRYKRQLEEEKENREKQGYADRYTDPEQVKRHYEFMDHYHAINAHSLVPGTKVIFNLFIRSKNVISTAIEKGNIVDGDKRGQWIAEDANLLIRKESKNAYRSYMLKKARTSKDQTIRAAFVRENARLLVENLAENPRSGKLMNETKVSVTDLTEVVLDNPTSFYGMTKVNNHDYYTFTHSVNVSTLTIAMAVASGIDDRAELLDIGLGSMLHDLGKAKVDPKIINKPGRLTNGEYKKVINHVTLGYEMVKGNPAVPERALHPLLQHHEKLTGTGYPNGLKGGQIHLYGRMAAIIDIYDALTTQRSYKKAFKPYDALVLLSKGEEDYDRGLLNILVSMLGKQGE